MADQSTALAIHQPAEMTQSASDFGEEHKRIVRDAYAPTASPAEFEVLWLGAKSRGLDPVRKQIHFVKRYDKARGADVWSSQVSIDGFRAIAQDTRLYDGQGEPEYEIDKNGGVLSVKVAVYRKDITRPFYGFARWSEFVQTTSGGSVSHMWSKMPFHMLAKCAEALALRKAFPEKLAGLYTPDEMGNDEPGTGPRTVDLTPREPAPAAAATATMTHIRVNGDAIFEAARADALLGLLAAAREEGHAVEAEQAFAGRVAVLFGTADAVAFDDLTEIAKNANIGNDSPARVTMLRARKAADMRLGPR